MTALKPLTSKLVLGVKADRYPLNEVCAHPACTEPAVDPHHCFPRSQIGNDSWFVKVDSVGPFPHVTGLCRAHHDDVEEHRAWIRMEEQHFVWYDRDELSRVADPEYDGWTPLGDLNPQPGSREGKPKPKRQPAKKREPRKERQTLTLRVPAEERERGADLLEDLWRQVEEKLRPGEEPRPIYYSIVDSFNFLLANADASDV